jgi:hypothetical protein
MTRCRYEWFVQGHYKEKVKREVAEREDKSRKVTMHFDFGTHT